MFVEYEIVWNKEKIAFLFIHKYWLDVEMKFTHAFIHRLVISHNFSSIAPNVGFIVLEYALWI